MCVLDKKSFFPNLELQMVMSPHVGAGSNLGSPEEQTVPSAAESALSLHFF